MLSLGLRIAFVTVLLDQFSKWALLNWMQMPVKQFVEVTPFFNLRMVWNNGVSFGMFSAESDLGRYALIGFALIVIGILVVWLKQAQTRLLGWAVGLVIGGAVGNVIDRVMYGAVADFFDFHALGYHFFTFNIADVAISLGVALLIYDTLFMSDDAGAAARQ
jgi:signal peptidase II